MSEQERELSDHDVVQALEDWIRHDNPGEIGPGDTVLLWFKPAPSHDPPMRVFWKVESGKPRRCDACGLDEEHADVAACMRALCRYIVPEKSSCSAAEFDQALEAAEKAMRARIGR